MVDKSHLDVKYGGVSTRINVPKIELSDFQIVIKGFFRMKDPPARIQLLKEDGNEILDLDDIPDEYYNKSKVRMVCLEVRTESASTSLLSQISSNQNNWMKSNRHQTNI